MFSSLAMHIAKLSEHLCSNKPYKFSELGLQPLMSNHKARVKINKQFIELSLEEVKSTARYKLSVTGLKDYISSGKGLKTFIAPQRDASPYILHDVLYDELQSSLVQ